MLKKVCYLVSLLIGFLILFSVYEYIGEKFFTQKLSCHKEVVVFDKVYEKTLLHDAQLLIASGNYEIEVLAEKAVYSNSDLFEYVSLEDVKKSVNSVLHQYAQGLHVKQNKSLHVKVIVYENDKANPGKKTLKSKLYRGYLVFSFSVEGVLVYKIQIDFMDYKALDIPKRIECAIKTFMLYKNGEE